MSENNGLYGMGKKRLALVWGEVDRCIFLKDNIILSVRFFAYQVRRSFRLAFWNYKKKVEKENCKIREIRMR